MSDSAPSLVAAFRIPLGEKAARTLASVLAEYPDHALTVDGVWLNVRKASA